ncbi:hypothetical protein GLOIN_2v1549754 [Rhizophagus irregularis DAOM 181602=DAOM 197198]|uniref:Uncharacterized protein n=1 Tax=Rhizophagus irregularis (strain DAOM 181602 / DAOM 197198 / MUCL 43194) TaxID=747089 RepID=A0A2P4QHP5_RHIID|nr:hypothetical protein GLOIN_2v1549754 [Rhizophagus irregularis DAOM 181602=DAOM 197198]POG77159.1 hypothetical protein GLOIN_2v1549754 [Rhizophagus irregularis DAOM 181602=DAOM 197198]|eukprot:XP_025184025.1 hypothetical protein GLOIN_2v1549754 [Rhizophagus irregularis DAOM 181602=DAOM 197198]
MNETPASISIETLLYFVKRLCIFKSCNLFFYINKSVILIVIFCHSFLSMLTNF